VRAPGAAELLEAWGQSAALGPVGREDELLRLAFPEDDAEALPTGERSARLLELRELLFGRELEGTAACPECGEAVEYSLDAAQLPSDAQPAELEPALRAPTGADLAAVAAALDVEAARELLVERCVGPGLSPEIVAAAVERLAAADPLGDAELALACPECGSRWNVSLDIGAWLWSELESWARRTVLDVHALASAYGWSEADVLALGPRRELYLELVNG
jgi:hypothetical protein